jgi:DNA (cytosine-5)-methyltransferase 1
VQLVLSLFPGIGLLDRAFEEEGFCVVRGPDLLWGGDVKRFHPPAGRFDGVIGGSPCQAFTSLAGLIKHTRGRLAPNLIPEYERVVREAAPRWFLHENVRAAPLPNIVGYAVDGRMVQGRWFGMEQSREHRMTFGVRVDSGIRPRLDISPFAAALDNPVWSPRVLASGGYTPKLHRKGGKPSRTWNLHCRLRSSAYFEEAKRLQGLPADFDLPGFRIEEKIRALGNAVPLPLARAVAKAVKRALDLPLEQAA